MPFMLFQPASPLLGALRRALRLAPLAPLCALAACAGSPRIDSQFGASMRQALAQQTLDPQAGENRRPVNGLDAPAAAAAYDNYQRSYSSQGQQQSGFTIGAGIK
jgi:type IV pilus biogenesis protein CpaD/CtpE